MSSGVEQGKEQIAKELLKNGSDIEFVMKVTHLSEEKIKEMCKEIEKE